MIKNIVLFILIVLPFALRSQSALQTLYFDFGPNDGTNGNSTINADANGHYWNNVTSASTLSLNNSANAGTGFSIKVSSGSFATNGILNGGLLSPASGNLGDLAIATATQDYCTTTTSVTFQISGLNLSNGYQFFLFGSRNSANPARISAYTLTGSNTFTGTEQTSGTNLGGTGYNGNISTILSSTIIYPNSSGIITLTVSVSSGTTAYLNAMKMLEFRTKYYSKATGNLDNLSTWGANTDGSGASPSNFTTDGTIYNIRNRTSATIAADWTVTGSGSKVLVGDSTSSINFIVPSAYKYSGTVDGSYNAILTLQNTFIPTIGSLSGNSTVIFNGSSQIIPAARYQNLTVNNSGTASIGGVTSIYGTLSVLNGTLVTNNSLTLKSTNASAIAMVGQVIGSINGNVTIERYIPAGQRSFRFISPSVNTSSSIKSNWQEGGLSNISNPNIGYGTHITGSTTDQSNGFDGTLSGNPSLFTYDNGNQLWNVVNNTNLNNLFASTGYRLLIRGDRTIDLTNNMPNPTSTTLRTTGTLVTGNITFDSTTSVALSTEIGNYNLIGNPYSAPIDWTTVSKNDIGSTYWTWDPTRSGTNNRGAYVSYTIGTGASGGGNINQYIQPGQAFFVQTTGPSPSITFSESNKATASQLTLFDTLINKSEFSLPLLSNKMVIAHCMPNIISFKGHPLEDGCNPDYYPFTNNTSSPIGGLSQVNPMADHFMRDSSLSSAVELEMRAAKKSGIDGFQFYYTVADSSWDSIIVAYFNVAAQKNIDFKFTFCFSNPILNGATETTKIALYASRVNAIMNAVGRNNSHWLRTPDGRLIVYLWYGQNITDMPWDSMGGHPPEYFYANSYNKLATAVGERFACIYSINANQTNAQVNALLNYFPTVWLWTQAYSFQGLDDSVASICSSRSRQYTASAFSDFYTSKVLYPGTWTIVNSATQAANIGCSGLERKCMKMGLSQTFSDLLNKGITQNTPLINIITWNDYPEGHHLAPEINHNFGFSVLLNYYKNLWINNTNPYSNRDVAIAFFKKYKSSVTPSPYNINVVNLGTTNTNSEDSIEVVTILPTAAQLTVNGVTISVPSGLTATKFVSTAGSVTVTISRNSVVSKTFTTPEWITNSPLRSDRLTYSFDTEFSDYWNTIFGSNTPLYSTQYAQ